MIRSLQPNYINYIHMPEKEKKYHFTTASLKETHLLGEKIGKKLVSGSIISLSGDLGAGKTSFVQGLAKGLEVPEGYYITSPTFNIINEYPGRFTFFHIDIYRLTSVYDLDEIGFDDIISGSGVVAIEWADKLPENFLSVDLSIHIEITDDTCRNFSIIIYGHSKINLLNVSV